MASGSRKRTLDSFFAPAAKKKNPSQPSQQGQDDGPPAPTDEVSLATLESTISLTHRLGAGDLLNSLHLSVSDPGLA